MKVSLFEEKKKKNFHDILIFWDAPVVSSVLTNAEAEVMLGNLKGKYTQNWKFCHHLFTLMSFRNLLFYTILDFLVVDWKEK